MCVRVCVCVNVYVGVSLCECVGEFERCVIHPLLFREESLDLLD